MTVQDKIDTKFLKDTVADVVVKACSACAVARGCAVAALCRHDQACAMWGAPCAPPLVATRNVYS